MDIGIIFDWDGVIIDSKMLHYEGWTRIAEEIGAEVPEDFFEKSFGMKNELIIPQNLKWTEDPAEIREISDKKESIYRELIREKGIEPLPGVASFIHELDTAGVPMAIGSSTHKLNIETALHHMPFENLFKGIISGEDVTHGKPHPEVFLLAASALGMGPHQCIVIEDAVAGIEAAHKAGMKAVAVTTTRTREALSDADLIVDSLDQLTLTDLTALLLY